MNEDQKPPQWMRDRAARIAETYGSEYRAELAEKIIAAMKEAGREVAFYFAALDKANVSRALGAQPTPSAPVATQEAKGAGADTSPERVAFARKVIGSLGSGA